jgi:hypothetical protein
MGIYQKVRVKFSTGNRYVYLTLMVTLCHCYNQIINATEEELREIFSEFLKDEKSPNRAVDFAELKSLFSRAEKQKLKNVIVQVLNKYFA